MRPRAQVPRTVHVVASSLSKETLDITLHVPHLLGGMARREAVAAYAADAGKEAEPRGGNTEDPVPRAALEAVEVLPLFGYGVQVQ